MSKRAETFLHISSASLRGVYKRVHDYRVYGEETGGGKEGYAGRGRVMHIDVDVHEFFILFYDFESHSLARKSISPPLGREHDDEKSPMCNTRSYVKLKMKFSST